jgi:hypothetical protein
MALHSTVRSHGPPASGVSVVRWALGYLSKPSAFRCSALQLAYNAESHDPSMPRIVFSPGTSGLGGRGSQDLDVLAPDWSAHEVAVALARRCQCHWSR